MNLIELLKVAVESRCRVTMKYDGKVREICPHLLGETKDKGLVVHAFQFGGETGDGTITSPEKGGWRFFYLNKIEGGLSLDGEGTAWYPDDLLAKTEEPPKPYVQPKFITRVLAFSKKVANG